MVECTFKPKLNYSTKQNNMKFFLLPLIVLGTFFLAINVSTVLADEKAEQFKFLIDGMKFEREKIVSGIVRGKGERTLEREVDGKSISGTGPVEYFLAFDFLEDNLRVDRHESHFKEDGSHDRRLGQYIETEDMIAYCSSLLDDPQTGIIFIANPKVGDYEFRNNQYCRPLDIRHVGLLDLWRFTHGDTIPFSAQLGHYIKRIPEVLVEEESGVFRIEYHQRVEDRGELRKSMLWIDTQNGFTVRRSLRIWEFDSRKDQPWIPEDIRTSWKRIGSVWVPVDTFFEKNLPIDEKEKFFMTFDWEGLNKPVDKIYFTYCDFDAQERTPIGSVPLKDARGGSTHHGDYFKLCGTKEGQLLMKQLAEKKNMFRWRVRLPLMIAGLSLIAFGLYLKFKKK